MADVEKLPSTHGAAVTSSESSFLYQICPLVSLIRPTAVREKVTKMPRGERVKCEGSTNDNSEIFPFLRNKSVCLKFVVDVKRRLLYFLLFGNLHRKLPYMFVLFKNVSLKR